MDIVERLREGHKYGDGDVALEAADHIEQLRAELAERDAEIERLRQELITAHCEYEEWTQERTALREDAERYRWLRDRVGVDNDHVTAVYVWMPSCNYKLDDADKRATDAAIDQAIKEEA